MRQMTSLLMRLESEGQEELPHAASLGPFLQGALMEQLDPEIAGLLHHLPFNPYSQYCYFDQEAQSIFWRVSALTDEATEKVIGPLLDVDAIELRGVPVTFKVAERSTETLSLKALTDLIYESGTSARIDVRFLTPTAFKSRGQYVIVPSVRLVVQNLLLHYNQVYDGTAEVDEDTIAYVEEHVRITGYRLRSCHFGNAAAAGRTIPAFAGTLRLQAKGAATMVGLVRMLLRFGEFAGVGIKTSMGMGGMRWL